MTFERALVAFAHPDDAEFGTSGTVAKWVSEGTEVRYVCVTDGSAGSNEPGATREEMRHTRRREQLAAAECLGVAGCTFLGYVDGEVEPTLELRRQITREVRRVRPDVFVVPDPTRFWDEERRYVNHVDHRNVGIACMAVVNPDAPTRPQFADLLEEGLEPFEIPNLWIPVYGGDADTFVDIGETLDKKIEALRCHASQMRNMKIEDVAERVRERARERGKLAGVEFAEGYKTFRLKEG